DDSSTRWSQTPKSAYNSRMSITIQPLEPHHIPEVKHLILSVARNIFDWERPLDELVELADENHDFYDIDDVGAHYFANQGMFLVALDDGRVIGSGAVRRMSARSCELKRMWLAEAYHGQGIGYRVMQELFGFARWAGYTRMELNTSMQQERAIQFYLRLGFAFMELDEDEEMDGIVFMEREL
ncbi:MAG TPA: GNAT family N-acetyltransferase, partial [Anaerolineales bacterium]|nr:GNAT family N-acetyltransferase [Anaerolineales bacterium]